MSHKVQPTLWQICDASTVIAFFYDPRKGRHVSQLSCGVFMTHDF